MQHVLKLLAILPLACASPAAAAPDSPARPAPQAGACRPTGAVLFEIDHRVIAGAKLGTSTIKLFSNGAWTREDTGADGKAAAPTSGCLAKADVKQLAESLHGAPWKVTTAQIHCMAVSQTFIDYKVDGKPVFTEKLCSGQSLDDKSRTVLEAAASRLEQTTARSTP